MEAKLYSELYNKHNPPKPIDIMQICIIRIQDFKAGNQEEYFQMEHFIEGDYKKFNSNSGYVSEDCRRTPQAFSHFSFEKSAREKMIIDIQGIRPKFLIQCWWFFRSKWFMDRSSNPFGEWGRLWWWQSWNPWNGIIFAFAQVNITILYQFSDNYFIGSKNFRCNDICEYLQLPKFALYESEKEAQSQEEIERSLTSLTRILSEVKILHF